MSRERYLLMAEILNSFDRLILHILVTLPIMLPTPSSKAAEVIDGEHAKLLDDAPFGCYIGIFCLRHQRPQP